MMSSLLYGFGFVPHKPCLMCRSILKKSCYHLILWNLYHPPHFSASCQLRFLLWLFAVCREQVDAFAWESLIKHSARDSIRIVALASTDKKASSWVSVFWMALSIHTTLVLALALWNAGARAEGTSCGTCPWSRNPLCSFQGQVRHTPMCRTYLFCVLVRCWCVLVYSCAISTSYYLLNSIDSLC